MRTAQLKLGSAALAGAVLACLPGSAHATLGGDIATVTANQQHMSAKRTVQPLIDGQRHDLTLASGTVVHEYLSAKGKVYAVSWVGPQPPDMTELFGSYFGQLATPQGRRRGGHHRIQVNGADLVVQASGHNNHYSGRAWVPSLVPAGVDASLAVKAEQ